METLAIVFAILALVFVVDLARIDQAELSGKVQVAEGRVNVSTVLALFCTIAAVTFGVLAAV